jgi:hypothetical protein
MRMAFILLEFPGCYGVRDKHSSKIADFFVLPGHEPEQEEVMDALEGAYEKGRKVRYY